MGYRTYIGQMPKREYNKIKSLTKDELIKFYNIENNFDDEDESWYKGVYEYGKMLYEFGKYTNFEPPKKSQTSFFKNKELKEIYSEYDFEIVTQDFLGYIIDSYALRVQDYYKKMLSVFDRETLLKVECDYSYDETKYKLPELNIEQQTQFYNMFEHIRSMASEWGVNDYGFKIKPYNLEDKDTITNSCKYEYAIFELKKIYNTFDWKKNVMIYYGY